MKKILIIALSLCLAAPALKAQVAWVSDLELGTALAKQNNKLLMIDFWAVWCGPCKTMDREVWNTEDGAKLSQKFVPVKIDIDYNKSLALQYNVRSIPAVIFVDVRGERIIDQVGYNNRNDILSVMEGLPANVEDLNNSLIALEEGEEVDALFAVAVGYQELVKTIEDGKVKNALLDKSDDYLRKASKATNDNKYLQRIELTEINNLIHRGIYKRALKKLDKNAEAFAGMQENASFMDYLYVLVYKGMGDSSRQEKHYSMLQARADGADYLQEIQIMNK